jgi:hypothetical protein
MGSLLTILVGLAVVSVAPLSGVQAGQDNRNMRAPPFRRDCAMASDTIAKLCSPADQSDSLVSVLRIF